MFATTEIDTQIIAEWRTFFGMAAGTSAGLAGLVFVALSMHLKEMRAYQPYLYRARGSLASMMTIFAVSSLVMFANQTSTWLGLEELAVIGADCAFLIWSFVRTREVVVKLPGWLTLMRPYQIRTTLAVGLSLWGMVGAALVWAGRESGFYVLAAFSVVTMVWVVINSWSLVVGVSDEAGSNESSGAK